MALKTYLDPVLETEDGPWTCWDAVVTAESIYQLWSAGFLKIDPDHQRGEDSVRKKPVLDMDKVERWADELIKGQAILGELSWNFRKGEAEIHYDEEKKQMEIGAGHAAIPDSGHRHYAIVKAVESASRGSGFDIKRRFSVRLYNVRPEEENRIFYAMNQEGKPADATRSKWLYPKQTGQRLAAQLVRLSPHLQDNVDTVRDRLSKRNPRLCAFNTLSRAFEANWLDVGEISDAKFDETVEFMVEFWDELVQVLPELGKLDLAERQRVREESIVDSAVAIHGYITLARRMIDSDADLAILGLLAEPATVNGEQVPFFSRTRNPQWEELGVVIPTFRRDNKRVLALRNANDARKAAAKAILRKAGLEEPPKDSTAVTTAA
jgi:hypothetical protein